MKYKWLNKRKNADVIIFFNGWGMDEAAVVNLSFGGYDVLMFYDYNTLETDFVFDELNNYRSRYLVAWSMGVMIATLFDIQYGGKTAINGTLKPIDDEFGIPNKIYDLTVAGLNLQGVRDFIKKMYKNGETDIVVSRDLSNQISELKALKNYSSNMDFKYDKVIISDKDRIIPTKNQVKFWGIEPNLNSGHAPFECFKNWGELI